MFVLMRLITYSLSSKQIKANILNSYRLVKGFLDSALNEKHISEKANSFS